MICTIFVLSTVLLLSCPAAAATVESVKGKVLINRGDGFQPVTNGAPANAGDRLMASAAASAKLVYSGRCRVNVVPGRRWSAWGSSLHARLPH